MDGEWYNLKMADNEDIQQVFLSVFFFSVVSGFQA